MTPAARLQAAIDILEGLSTSRLPADRFIREFFRARRYAGSKDRASVTERVYDIFRHRASYAWRMQSESPRALAIASVLAEGGDVASLFSGGYGPTAITDAENAAIAAPPREPPQHVKCEYPEFLTSELQRAFGGDLAEEMAAVLTRASVDLRVNALKTTASEVLAALHDAGHDAIAANYAPTALRLPAGTRGLEQSKPFLDGAFEFQDEAAQIAALLCNAKPGMSVLDLAAGAGGKSLALAASMHNKGRIVAADIEEKRLHQIGPRAERAGAGIIEPRLNAALRKDELFDLVLVDAPCSGTGTWRRQPENKWRLTQQRLTELQSIQDSLLDQAAVHVKPDGRLVYATCSILPCENEDRIDAFLARHPEFAVREAAEVWTESCAAPAPPGLGQFFKATPLTTGTDGFFTAILARK